MSFQSDRLAIIGTGLINGSLALALKEAGKIRAVVGCARRAETLERARALGLCDEVTSDPAAAVRGADMVVLGTPPGALGTVAAALAPGLDAAAVVTDVGSVKSVVVAAVRAALPWPERFVGGHPVAGTEHSGPEAAFASLFHGRRCILTPTAATAPAATARVRAMWEDVGASVDEMDPVQHDRILAITSHLPHLIAYTIVGTVADLEEQVRSEVFKYAAGGFTDFTRIAASDPVMWRDVFLHNKEATIEMLGRFTEDLIALQRAIRWDQGDVLEDLFTRTRAIRRGVVAAGQAYVRQPEDPLATDS